MLNKSEEFQGSETILYDYNGGYVSLYICENPQNVKRKE